MISHTDCSHESTRSARAKCRRARANGEPPKVSLVKGATVKVVDFAPTEKERKGTPRDRDMQCDVCGVERIALRGTDPLTGLIITVGEKCSYMLKQSLDIKVLG